MKYLFFVLPRRQAAAGLALAAALVMPAAAGHAQAPAKPAAAGPTLSIDVTDRGGEPLGDVSVVVTGPVDRSGTTGEQGAIVFRAMRAGTYRLRFEHEGFVTLERDVVMTAKPATISVALTSLPAPGPQPEPELPAEREPEPGSAPAARDLTPRMLSIPDFLDKHLIGGEPHRSTLLGCADGGTARLLQIRDPLEHQLHDDLDEILYVVAGAGVLRIDARDTRIGPGFFALVPRGVTHSLRRQGRNPLIALSVLTGEPCVAEP
jgi:hypothetical protein